MATTFDTPILVTEVNEGRFRIFHIVHGALPLGVPLREPKTLHSYYRITGPYQVFYRLSPPDHDVSREEVIAWLEDVRRLGCEVKPGELAFSSLRA